MAPHIDVKKFCDIDIDTTAQKFNICNFIDQTRNEYNNFICEYGLVMEKVIYIYIYYFFGKINFLINYTFII